MPPAGGRSSIVAEAPGATTAVRQAAGLVVAEAGGCATGGVRSARGNQHVRSKGRGVASSAQMTRDTTLSGMTLTTTRTLSVPSSAG